MSLWPGYYINKFEAIPDPIIHEVPIFRIETEQEPVSETKTTAGSYYMFGPNSYFLSANGFVILEQFGSGRTITWSYYFDEWHWIIKGEADVSYKLASTARTVAKKMHIKAGDYLITPRGSEVTFTITSKEPLRRYCGMMPGYALHPRLVETMLKKKIS